MLRNSPAGYGWASKGLHWLIALGMIGLTALGAWMVTLGYFDPWYNRSLALHRSLGMVVLALAVAFAVWKVVSPSPPLQETLRPWERAAAHAAHAVLLCAMFVLPVSGYLISTSAGAGFPFFGLGTVPAVGAVSESGRDLAIAVHWWAAYGLAAVAAVHAGAALKHQFIDRHGTLKRML